MVGRGQHRRVAWISAAAGVVATVAAGIMSGIVVADAAVQPGSAAQLSAHMSQARPAARPRPTATATSGPAPTVTSTASPTTSPAACETTVLLYSGQPYCSGYLSWVKSRYYGIGVRVAIAGTVDRVTGSAVVLTDTFRCPPDRWCGALVTSDSLQVTFASGAALPTQRQIIRLYGTTTAGTTSGGLNPAGFEVLGVAPTATAACDPELTPC